LQNDCVRFIGKDFGTQRTRLFSLDMSSSYLNLFVLGIFAGAEAQSTTGGLVLFCVRSDFGLALRVFERPEFVSDTARDG
jgi:hypothetical protein